MFMKLDLICRSEDSSLICKHILPKAYVKMRCPKLYSMKSDADQITLFLKDKVAAEILVGYI